MIKKMQHKHHFDDEQDYRSEHYDKESREEYFRELKRAKRKNREELD